VLAYYAYARIIENQNIHVTRFGVVFKNNADVSERVDEKTLQRLILQTRNQARAYWDECQLFLNRKSASYPLWANQPNTKPRINISAVG
jgi:prephenate dehydratase